MTTPPADADPVGAVFAALADPTRRHVIDTLLREGTTTVPQLTSELPITRQGIAKHVDTLADAGLVTAERGRGREVRYRLRPNALSPASAWMRAAEASWDRRLGRLRDTIESSGEADGASDDE